MNPPTDKKVAGSILDEVLKDCPNKVQDAHDKYNREILGFQEDRSKSK